MYLHFSSDLIQVPVQFLSLDSVPTAVLVTTLPCDDQRVVAQAVYLRFVLVAMGVRVHLGFHGVAVETFDEDALVVSVVAIAFPSCLEVVVWARCQDGEGLTVFTS